MHKLLLVSVLFCVPLAAQEIPRATALSGDPFYIKKTWYIGGVGNWDYLTIDPTARRLYIAHGTVVQVVSIDTGELVAQIPGFREAHAVALDDTGAYAYVTDGQADAVDVVDRRRLEIESTIPIYCSPRSIAFEPGSRLVFAICGGNVPTPPAPEPSARRRTAGSNRPARPTGAQEQPDLSGNSHVIAIDAESKSVLADLAVPGDFRFAQPDGDGHVYVSVGEAHQTWIENGGRVQNDFPQSIARLDVPAIVADVHQQQEAQTHPASSPNEPVHFDWSHDANPGADLRFIPLRSNCANPQGLAVDSRHLRLFLACDDQKLLVLNAGTGDVVASLTTGPGDDVLGYDRERGLVFVANGAGYGSLSIIRQDGTTDSYEVIQNLPTRERARTLAVDSSTGDAYLVTDFYGVDLTKPGTIGTLNATPINGSFQVLDIGH
jgi:DNA-binding beta-propeller fold protein YncE